MFISSNIKNFQEKEIPSQDFNEICSYVCYEKIHYLIFKYFYKTDNFPLFYLDRCFGWTYSDAKEPIFHRYNGFLSFLEKSVFETVRVYEDDLLNILFSTLNRGLKISMVLSMDYKGSKYPTSVLIEGMDGRHTVYITKVNDTNNKMYTPMNISELRSRLCYEDTNEIELLIFKYPKEIIENISSKSTHKVLNYIFSDLFKLSIIDKEVLLGEKQIFFDVEGFELLEKSLVRDKVLLLQGQDIDSIYQTRIYTQIYNKIQPIQIYLKLLLSDPDLESKISEDVKILAKEHLFKVDYQLKQLEKFASLLFQCSSAQFYKLYYNSVIRLKELMKECQEVNSDILSCLIL